MGGGIPPTTTTKNFFNALLNIPGTASRLTLVEDKQYVLTV